MKFFSQIERPQRRKRDAGIKTLIMASRGAQIVRAEEEEEGAKKGAVIRQFRFVKVSHIFKTLSNSLIRRFASWLTHWARYQIICKAL